MNIFYLRSWLILSIVISQPPFDHRLTLTIYLNTSVWVNQYKRNREFGLIYSSKFHDTSHVSKITIKTSYYYIRSKSLITLNSTQRTPPGVSSFRSLGFVCHPRVNKTKQKRNVRTFFFGLFGTFFRNRTSNFFPLKFDKDSGCSFGTFLPFATPFWRKTRKKN